MKSVCARLGWVLVIAACCLGLLVPASSAAGNPPDWRIVASPNVPGPNGVLEAISCASQSQCIAVGYLPTNTQVVHQRPLSEIWNGQRWVVLSTPTFRAPAGEILTDVSCATAS